MSNKLITIFFLFILLTPLSLARPSYNSIPDSTFTQLPPYPSDLPEISSLFKSNNINITQIPPSYYLQPEFYPQWPTPSLYNPNRTHYGVYGFNIYPSSYTINTQAGNHHTITAFICNGFGVSVKTGCQLNITYDHSLISLTSSPSDPFLLNQTHPQFTPDWVQPLTLDLTILKNQSSTITIYNSPPPPPINKAWSQLYANQYTTPSSFKSTIPSLTITINTPSPNPPTQSSMTTPLIFYLIIIFIIIILGVKLCITVKKRR